jgi:hypothetical protein
MAKQLKTSMGLNDVALANLATIREKTGSNQTSAVENAVAIYATLLTEGTAKAQGTAKRLTDEARKQNDEAALKRAAKE